MEKVKKIRAMQRGAFTRVLNGLITALTEEVPDKEVISVSFEILEEKFAELKIRDDQILQMLVDADTAEADMIQEIDTCDEYKAKLLKMKKKVVQVMNIAEASAGGTGNDGHTQKAYRLPKIELKKFNGDVKNWLQFWSQFKKIHVDSNIAPEDKFQYLIQTMVPDSQAGELVDSFPPTAENYEKVITSLKNRYGRDELQVEVYVRELLKLVLRNAVNPQEKVHLSSLYDKIESQLRALETLGVTTDKCAAMVYPLVESCLPEDVLRAWQRSGMFQSSNTASKDRLTQLIEFLQTEVENEQRISMAVKGFDLPNERDRLRKPKFKTDGIRDIPSATGLLVTDNETRKNTACIFCGEAHDNSVCDKARTMDTAERQKIVRERGACFRCLKLGHRGKQCHVQVKCAWCQRRHVLIMCPGVEKTAGNSETKEPSDTVAVLANCGGDPEVLMQTLRVRLQCDEKEAVVRAVIDTGSQKSYVTKEAAAHLGYKPIGNKPMTHSLFGGHKSATVYHQKYMVTVGSLVTQYRCRFAVLDEEIICDEVPLIKSGVWSTELQERDIKITDMAHKDPSITLLIGADVAGKLLTGRRYILKCGLVAIETYLGWTLIGNAPGTSSRGDAAISAISLFVGDNCITDLWSLDVLGIKDPIESQSQKAREKEMADTFMETVKINKENRYEIKLPWLPNHPALGDNKDLAVRRLQATTRKLKADGLFEDYDAVFKKWMSEGIIECVPKGEENEWGHYLPHRHVIKENSTTRIRPVFDASAKSELRPSLNECLEKGPNLIELIATVLLRFREGSIGVISDIEKAFLQISVDSKDRDFLRFLWYDDQGNTVVFRHCRVVFGVSCSPFILGAVIMIHLTKIMESIDKSETNFSKQNIVKLSKDFYVDNCVTSVNSLERFYEFKSDASDAMRLGEFNLRGWEYNGDVSHQRQTAVLGIIWHKDRDSLSLNVPTLDSSDQQKVTKRAILAVAHRVFDPLGMACPVLLRPRILLQQAWAQGLSWDDEVGQDIKKIFLGWIDELRDLSKMEVPRCLIGNVIVGDNVSVHTFCDASRLAYAAVTYIRVTRGPHVSVHFVQAKARVAPARKGNTDARQSIPRLELLAATIGVRLTESILSSLGRENIETHYWTDSSTVLAWIRRECNWGTFVFNRVHEIRQVSNPECWRHVPGKLNPADLPSRGCTVSQLLTSRWWEGPEWLRMTRENWPSDETPCNEDEVRNELKKTASRQKLKADIVTMLSRVESREATPWYGQGFSKYYRILRLLAWIRRFCYNCRKPEKDRVRTELTVRDITEAEVELIKDIQSESFSDEKDERIAPLLAYRDDKNVIRLKTKILARDDTFDFRCPAILPANHIIVKRLIMDRHERLMHAGVEILMSNLREQYWILGGRRTLRAVLRECIICRRHEGKPMRSDPVALPRDRVRDAAVFEIIGVDLAGPVFLKGSQKAWICLFTCAVYRAVHLELVSSLSTAVFLGALRRFIGRRGRPAIIYSDNGKNFVGLNNLMRNIDDTKLIQFGTLNRIEWRFNPPAAPWWGGWWERLIGLVKKLLKRTLKNACLTYEEMGTVLCDCEAVINSRPITFVSDAQQESVPVTPSMFLQEIREIGVPECDAIESRNLGKRFRYRQKIIEDLRRRFRIEYLSELVLRKGKACDTREVKVGDIVLVEKEGVKRLEWPLARIKDVIVGKDGRARVFRLTTATGELLRPLQRLIPLEIETGEVNDNRLKDNKAKGVPPCEMVNRDAPGECYDHEHRIEKPSIVTRSGRKIKKPERLSYH